MLSQCKDANPAARIERFGRLTRVTRDSRELKNLNFGGYSRRVNQSGACSSSDVIRADRQKSNTPIWTKSSSLDTRSCTIDQRLPVRFTQNKLYLMFIHYRYIRASGKCQKD